MQMRLLFGKPLLSVERPSFWQNVVAFVVVAVVVVVTVVVVFVRKSARLLFCILLDAVNLFCARGRASSFSTCARDERCLISSSRTFPLSFFWRVIFLISLVCIVVPPCLNLNLRAATSTAKHAYVARDWLDLYVK